MKCKTMKHGNIGLQCMMLAFIFTVCFSSCKDDKDTTAAPYDPSQPVEVTDFTPKSGGTKVCIHFGAFHIIAFTVTLSGIIALLPPTSG